MSSSLPPLSNGCPPPSALPEAKTPINTDLPWKLQQIKILYRKKEKDPSNFQWNVCNILSILCVGWTSLSCFESVWTSNTWGAISHLRGDYSLIVGQLHVQQVWNASKSNNFEFCFVGDKEGLLPRNVQPNEGGKVFDSTWCVRTPQERTLINLNWCRCQQLQPAVIKRVINLSIAMFFSNWLKVCL